MATIVPELVEGFPTYPAADIAIGSLQGDYPKQAVLDWLGLTSRLVGIEITLTAS